MNHEKINTPNIMGIDNQEIKMIKLIADGLTYTEISDKMNVKPSKIENLRKTLISKTKTKNAASLVSFAYRYGLLKVWKDKSLAILQGFHLF